MANLTTQYRSVMEKPQAPFHRSTTQRPNVGESVRTQLLQLSIVGQGWGRLPLSFPGNTPCYPPCTAWQQARQPRIESSASIAGGTKTRVSPDSDKETYPPSTPLSIPAWGRPSLYWHPDSRRRTFPILLLTATAHKLTEQRVGNPIPTARLSGRQCLPKNLSSNFNQLELLDSPYSPPTHSCGF